MDCVGTNMRRPHCLWLNFEHTKNSNLSKKCNFRDDKIRNSNLLINSQNPRNRSNWFRAGMVSSTPQAFGLHFAYGVEQYGLSPTDLTQFRSTAVACSGDGGHQACPVSAIEIGMGQQHNPAIQARLCIFSWWLRCWDENRELHQPVRKACTSAPRLLTKACSGAYQKRVHLRRSVFRKAWSPSAGRCG